VQHAPVVQGLAQTQPPPASVTPPELLPVPLLLPATPLDDPLEPPDDLPEEPLDDPVVPLEDPVVPLEEPLPDPPPLELEPETLAHSLAQWASEHVISLSPVARDAVEQLQAAMHALSVPPRRRQPMYVSHAGS
jgi:hypothetical protein